MRGRRAAILLGALILFVGSVAAHVPAFPSDNTSPDAALEVPDAVKSWSFYDRLAPGQTKYYLVSLEAGQRLRLGTFTPSESAVVPGLVVMSPDLPTGSAPPAGVEVPDDMGFEIIPGTMPARATFEPFAPSAYYRTASVDRPVDSDRTYLIAVYDVADRSGPVGVTVGYTETFSLEEYLLVPFDLVRIHLWAGQNPVIVWGPFVGVALAGVVVLGRRWDLAIGGPHAVAMVGAGVLILASSARTLVELGVALVATGPRLGAMVTLVYIVIPVLAGGWAIRVGTRPSWELSPATRVTLLVAAVGALSTWAGFVIGPVALAVTAFVPSRRRS